MGYDLRYEAVCKYTEDGITQSKEFLSFLKKRHALEVEYTKALNKLCKSYERAGGGNIKRSSKKLESDEKASVQSTTLTQALNDVIDGVSNSAQYHTHNIISNTPT